MTSPVHPVFAQLRAAAASGPVVVAHRGDSRNHPENTLAAFRAATALGVGMQEFDVQQSRDGELFCLHDASLDRTTDAARVLGPGALLAQSTTSTLARLDAGAWKGEPHRGERVPTLAAALQAMPAPCIAMIEHKAGEAAAFVAAVRTAGRTATCLLQSFDWAFVAAVRQLAPEIANAVLGPVPQHPVVDDELVAKAKALGAGMVHWHARELDHDAVLRLQRAGLLVCTYTTDDELGWLGGAALGFDAMCTNDPARMLAAATRGLLRRR